MDSFKKMSDISCSKLVKSLKRCKKIEKDDCPPEKKRALTEKSNKSKPKQTETLKRNLKKIKEKDGVISPLLTKKGKKNSKLQNHALTDKINFTVECSNCKCSNCSKKALSSSNFSSCVNTFSETPANHLNVNQEKSKAEAATDSGKTNFNGTVNIYERLASIENVDVTKVRNIVQLFEAGNTIPFVARYRSNLTGSMEPEKLRKIKASYEYLKQVNEKAEKLIKKFSSNVALVNSLRMAQSLEELEFLTAPFKSAQRKTLANRARELNLEHVAQQILNGKEFVFLYMYVKPNCEGLKTVEQVELGIQHIIADVISKDLDIHSILLKIIDSGSAVLKCQEKNSSNTKNKSGKYATYNNFSQVVKFVKPHQMLAISRGEAECELSVKIEIPVEKWLPVKECCYRKWVKNRENSFSTKNCESFRHQLIEKSVNDSIKRLLSPFVVRRIRSNLDNEAQIEAIKVFEANLKQLLLTPPCKGKIIMGIDPGFRHGCKFAVISEQGVPLGWSKFFLPKWKPSSETSGEAILKDFILKFRCDIIALGNGTACRETELFLADLIKKRTFDPLNVFYTIVSEHGVSIYSCSAEAKEEFPNLNVFFVGAVSLARRLQDPLSELVKVEPKHLGIGLYQHDMNNSRLNSALQEIVSECVSFVGVDVNTASYHVLRRVAGLNTAKAKELILYRNENFGIGRLEELKKIKGIKEETFRQCAGFLRIVKSAERCEMNPLDQTSIHPESYETTYSIAKKFKLDVRKIGSESFIKQVKSLLNQWSVQNLADEFRVPVTEIQLIMDIFKQPIDHDPRRNLNGPIYRSEVMTLEEIKTGQELTGVVLNVVPFGAFVDIGVHTAGLLHTSKSKGETLALNDRVLVRVMSVDLKRNRISLMLKQKINPSTKIM